MNHSEIIQILSSRLDVPQTEVKRLLNTSTAIIRDHLDQDKTVALPGLGTFHAAMKRERRSFNPFIKKYMLLPKKRVVKYHPSLAIKETFKNKRVES